MDSPSVFDRRINTQLPLCTRQFCTVNIYLINKTYARVYFFFFAKDQNLYKTVLPWPETRFLTRPPFSSLIIAIRFSVTHDNVVTACSVVTNPPCAGALLKLQSVRVRRSFPLPTTYSRPRSLQTCKLMDAGYLTAQLIRFTEIKYSENGKTQWHHGEKCIFGFSSMCQIYSYYKIYNNK